MNETIADVFRQARREAEKNVRNNELNTIVYMSGTKNKKTKMKKMLEKYKEDSKMDFELGVIAKEIYEFEIQAAAILENSLQHFQIY